MRFLFLALLLGACNVEEIGGTDIRSVALSVPGWKPVYVFEHALGESTLFQGDAFQKEFIFQVDANGVVTVEGESWIGDLVTCGSDERYVLWRSGASENDIEIANKFGERACSVYPYILPAKKI